MKTGGIGRLIGELRKEAKIPQKRLCKGLCSVQLLSKIELEERTPDMLLLEALMQRLGKSPEKLEIILSLEEYQHIEARDEIEDALRFGKLEEAEEKLNVYLKKYEHEGIMQQMYGYRMRGAIAIEKGAYETAEESLRKAVILSVAEENWKKLETELLSTFELENFVLLCQAWCKQGKESEAKEQLEELSRYVREHITDDEEFVKIQSKIASLLGAVYKKKGDYEKCIELCEPVFELERDLFLLQCMSLLMDNLILAYRQTNENEKVEKLCTWKEHIEAVYAMQGLSIDIVNGMYFNFYARQYYLDCELIRGERIRQGLTQAELAEGIYECVESLSRVENGKESPNRIKFQQLMERLGVDKSRYNGHLATSEYRAMEIDLRIENLLTRDYFKEAQKELAMLEDIVDLTEIQNIQLIQRRKNIFLDREKQVSVQQMAKKTRDLLSLTYDVDKKELSRIPFRNEVYLYNVICGLKWKMGQKEEALMEYLKAIKCFENSRIAKKYHFRSIGILVINLSDKMERINYLEDAEYWTRWEIDELLKRGKGTNIERFLSTLVCILEKRDEERAMYVELAYHTLWCGELFKQERFCEIIRNYMKEHFGEI